MLSTARVDSSLSLNVPSLSFEVDRWVVCLPGPLGHSQRYRCATQAVAQRLLSLFARATRRPSARAGWPSTR
ncbi:MAG: hypothetical protein AMXMBFR34_23450 [Myxococcaceae bacterium]